MPKSPRSRPPVVAKSDGETFYARGAPLPEADQWEVCLAVVRAAHQIMANAPGLTFSDVISDPNTGRSHLNFSAIGRDVKKDPKTVEKYSFRLGEFADDITRATQFLGVRLQGGVQGEQHPVWDADVAAFVGIYLKRYPKTTVAQLTEMVNTFYDNFPGYGAASQSQLYRLLRGEGYSCKRIQRIPPGQFTAANLQHRAELLWYLDHKVPPWLLFFLDESNFGHQFNAKAPMGWAPGGERAVGVMERGLVDGHTLIACVGLNGIAFAEVHSCTTTAELFLRVWKQGIKRLPQWCVVVMDNAPVHSPVKDQLAQTLWDECKGTLRFLPPYSPDISPIEPLFGQLKRQCRRVADFSQNVPHHIIAELAKITTQQIAGWWSHKCGYPLVPPAPQP